MSRAGKHRKATLGALAALVCCAVLAESPKVDPLAERANPWSEKVRGLLLVAPCAACHRSTLKSAVPAALLVFDLDQPVWHRTLSVNQAKELGRRAETLKEIDAFDRDAVARFVTCRTGGDCTPLPKP